MHYVLEIDVFKGLLCILNKCIWITRYTKDVYELISKLIFLLVKCLFVLVSQLLNIADNMKI